MRTLTTILVLAKVRIAGTDRRHELRSFHFMLDEHDPLDKQRAEAKRICRQIGYDVTDVHIPPPGAQQ